MMFGLEGNGFLISLMVTFLLAGAIMYYMRREQAKLESKVSSMFELVQSITSELQKINTILIQNEGLNEEESNQDQVSHSYNAQPESEVEEVEEEEEQQVQPIQEIHSIEGFINIAVPVPEDKPEDKPEEIKVVELAPESDLEDSELEDTEDDEEDEEDDKIEIQLEEEKKVEILDYSKLQVAALREIVEEKGLATNAKKLKKAQLLELLS